MATVTRFTVSTDLRVSLELTESEVRALDGIFGYNVDAFLKVFYERMGRAYVEKHEAGVRSLHATIRGALAKPLSAIDDANRALREATANRPKH